MSKIKIGKLPFKIKDKEVLRLAKVRIQQLHALHVAQQAYGIATELLNVELRKKYSNIPKSFNFDYQTGILDLPK